MSRLVLYMAAPLRPTEAQIAEWSAPARALPPRDPVAAATRANLERAMRWLAWLRRTFPETTFVAPWIASLLAGENDADPAQREAGLVDACAVIPLLHGVVLCGGRESGGMTREAAWAQDDAIWDLTALGGEPPPVLDVGYPPFHEWARARRRPAP